MARQPFEVKSGASSARTGGKLVLQRVTGTTTNKAPTGEDGKIRENRLSGWSPAGPYSLQRGRGVIG
jgi:hypothetical protein